MTRDEKRLMPDGYNIMPNNSPFQLIRISINIPVMGHTRRISLDIDHVPDEYGNFADCLTRQLESAINETLSEPFCDRCKYKREIAVLDEIEKLVEKHYGFVGRACLGCHNEKVFERVVETDAKTTLKEIRSLII